MANGDNIGDNVFYTWLQDGELVYAAATITAIGSDTNRDLHVAPFSLPAFDVSNKPRSVCGQAGKWQPNANCMTNIRIT